MSKLRSGATFAWLFLALATVLGPAVPVGSALAGTGSTPLLIQTRVDLTPDVISSIAAQTVQITQVWPEIRAMAVIASPGKISALMANPHVEVVEPDLEAGVTGLPSSSRNDSETPALVTVPLSTSTTPIVTWNQDMANTPGSAETGQGVTVVVLDSGLPQNWAEFLPPNSVDVEHAAGFGAEGWGDFHSQVNAIRGVGGHIGLFPHGLAVSSVIVGFPSDFGPVAGAAPGARILPIRVLNQFNFGWFSWFTAGILHAANLKASGAVPGPMVINFSIQAGGSSQVLTSAIDYAISQGVLFVTIAGNFHPYATVAYPGRLPQSITAAAGGWVSEWSAPFPWFFADVPENDASQVYIADFSCREPASVPPASMIDVTAPGSYVFGEWLYGPGFSEGREVAFNAMDNFLFGTSFAAPHVAGIVARMLEKNPGLTQANAEALLRGTALPIPPAPVPPFFWLLPWDERATGAGLVQGAEAVAATPVPVAVAAKLPLDSGRSAALREAPSIQLRSRAGSVPVEFGMKGVTGGPHRISLFDVRGRLVRRWTAPDPANVTWDGARSDGSPAGSGVYFVRAEGEGARLNAKFVVAR